MTPFKALYSFSKLNQQPDIAMSGEGVYKWADGATYQGSWRENKMHGQGKYVDKEGDSWKGQFHNGKYFNGKSYIILR